MCIATTSSFWFWWDLLFYFFLGKIITPSQHTLMAITILPLTGSIFFPTRAEWSKKTSQKIFYFSFSPHTSSPHQHTHTRARHTSPHTTIYPAYFTHPYLPTSSCTCASPLFTFPSCGRGRVSSLFSLIFLFFYSFFYSHTTRHRSLSSLPLCLLIDETSSSKSVRTIFFINTTSAKIDVPNKYTKQVQFSLTRIYSVYP